MDAPHWLLQELAGEAIWTALGLGVGLAWKYREDIRERFKATTNPPTTVVQLTGIPSDELVGTLTSLTVGSERQILYDVLATVGSERKVMWNIEAPTRQQVKRVANELLELGLWYLRS